jgi:hypothetical protein
MEAYFTRGHTACEGYVFVGEAIGRPRSSIRERDDKVMLPSDFYCMRRTHDAKQALMTDQQLADRFEGIELPRWEDDSTYHQLLSSFSAILPLRCASDLLDIKVRKQILILSEGVMVRICRLLEAAAIEAIRNRTESIHLGSLNSELIAQSLVSVSDRSSRRVTG